jgi:hypothetical protein
MMYVSSFISKFILLTFFIFFKKKSIGPIAQFHENSSYYSAVRPVPNPEVDQHLPHITIEMPVYKESLEETM